MLKLVQCLLFALIVSTDCDHEYGQQQCKSGKLIVDTSTGKVKGKIQHTFFHGTKYISFIGIPYAEPPTGNLRFREPVPKKRWQGVLETNDRYGDACIPFSFQEPLNTTKSENCLFLNVYRPAEIAVCEKLSVMFFIHGGDWTEGEGSDQQYGADHLMEAEMRVILVTINYRLGPLGFMNLDHPECSGNMGLKDQQLALKWVHENIENFGGDQNCITIFGQSVGGASVHFHLLSSESRKYFKRGICMSGTALCYFSSPDSDDRNHKSLVIKTFSNRLSNRSDTNEILNFLKEAPVDVLQQLPVANNDTVFNGLDAVKFTPVVESKQKKDSKIGSHICRKPFITEHPIEIIKNTRFKKDMMFGFTSLEFLWYTYMWDNNYKWADDLNKNFSIVIPVHHTESLRNTEEYKELQKKVRAFYFENGPIEKNEHNLRKYLRLLSAMNYPFPIHRTAKLHVAHTEKRTFYYMFDVDLNLSFTQISEAAQKAHLNGAGSGHTEDLCYIFRQKMRQQLYDNVKKDLNDPKNRKTLRATSFVPGFHVEFAKTGKVRKFKSITRNKMNCIKIANDGFKQISSPYEKSIQFWNSIFKEGHMLITSGKL